MKIQNNVTFGAKIPTKSVVTLASNRKLYGGAWDDNIKSIEKLAGKGSTYNLEPMETVIAFNYVAKVLNKCFPELEPFLKDIERIISVREANSGEKINKIFKAAENKFGKEMDVPEGEIKEILRTVRSPYGLLLV